MRLLAAAAALAVVVTGCGGASNAKPKDDPGNFAVKVVGLIVHNRYEQAWKDLHPTDQKVAPLVEYVGCENANPVLTAPMSVRVLSVSDESVGLGNGSFVESKAVDVRMSFAGNFHFTHTVHLVAADGKWTWILPSWRFRDYRADRCPSNAGSTPSPASS